MSSKLNSDLSDAAWGGKRATLHEHTVLRLNTNLLDDAGNNWNEAAIQKRGEKLHEEAIKVWPHASSIKT